MTMHTCFRLVPAVLLLSGTALADSGFTVRRMTRTDVPLGKGQCDIRLQVDGEAEIALRGAEVRIRTISGREPYDHGSECNDPLPTHDVQDFGFEVRDRRGDIVLLAEPSPRNGYRAIVRIRDGKSGQGRYHFRLTWRMTGGSWSPGGRDGYDGRRPGRR